MTTSLQRPAWLSTLLRVALGMGLVLLIPVVLGMQWENFTPLLTASSLSFFARGALITVAVSLVSIVLSLPLATLLALGRLSARPWLKWLCTLLIEGVRALPLLLLILYINLRLTLSFLEQFRLDDNTTFTGSVINEILSQGSLSVVLALTVYTAAVNAELLRSGILSLERGQAEAGMSLGLTYWQRQRHIILPQAFRRILAPLIAQFTILVKDTSLGLIVGLVELLRRTQILFQLNSNPLEALYLVSLMYFVINFALGQVSQWIERRRPSVHVMPEA